MTLNERTIDREVIVARESGILRLLYNAIKKSCNESMLCESITIFCEDSWIKDLIAVVACRGTIERGDPSSVADSASSTMRFIARSG